MIKAYHAADELGGVKIEFEGSAEELLREYARISEEICTALAMANRNDNDDYEYCELEPGDHFYYSDYEYVLLDITDSGDYFAITADIADDRQFNNKGGDGSNNWAQSDLRHYLNGEYINETGITKEHLVKSQSDLVADNGDHSYGTCEDYITLLSCDQYRKYREIVPQYSDYIWTLTPWSCVVGHAYYVRIVTPSGALHSNNAHYAYGVAPACTFNHEILIPRRQAHTGRIILDEATGSDGED